MTDVFGPTAGAWEYDCTISLRIITDGPGSKKIPLTVMDCILDREGYVNLNYDAARHLCFSLFNQVKRHNGELVLLWHNTELTEEKRHHGSYQPRLYQDVLCWIQDNGGDHASRRVESAEQMQGMTGGLPRA